MSPTLDFLVLSIVQIRTRKTRPRCHGIIRIIYFRRDAVREKCRGNNLAITYLNAQLPRMVTGIWDLGSASVVLAL